MSWMLITSKILIDKSNCNLLAKVVFQGSWRIVPGTGAMAARSFNKLPRVGRASIKRSWQHLNSDKVILQDNIKKIKVMVGPDTRNSFGAR